MFNKRKEQTKEQLQKRQNASILGELMFNEEFIRQNLLITDDKNNLRFLSSVYSELSGYCESNICKQKRIGKLSFLRGIKSISISEELENTKIQEIKAIIKSRDEKRRVNLNDSTHYYHFKNLLQNLDTLRYDNQRKSYKNHTMNNTRNYCNHCTPSIQCNLHNLLN